MFCIAFSGLKPEIFCLAAAAMTAVETRAIHAVGFLVGMGPMQCTSHARTKAKDFLSPEKVRPNTLWMHLRLNFLVCLD